MLVTLIAAKKNCFQELFKAIKTVRISKFIWQRVPDCRASVIKKSLRTNDGTSLLVVEVTAL